MTLTIQRDGTHMETITIHPWRINPKLVYQVGDMNYLSINQDKVVILTKAPPDERPLVDFRKDLDPTATSLVVENGVNSELVICILEDNITARLGHHLQIGDLQTQTNVSTHKNELDIEQPLSPTTRL